MVFGSPWRPVFCLKMDTCEGEVSPLTACRRFGGDFEWVGADRERGEFECGIETWLRWR